MPGVHCATTPSRAPCGYHADTRPGVRSSTRRGLKSVGVPRANYNNRDDVRGAPTACRVLHGPRFRERYVTRHVAARARAFEDGHIAELIRSARPSWPARLCRRDRVVVFVERVIDTYRRSRTAASPTTRARARTALGAGPAIQSPKPRAVRRRRAPAATCRARCRPALEQVEGCDVRAAATDARRARRRRRPRRAGSRRSWSSPRACRAGAHEKLRLQARQQRPHAPNCSRCSVLSISITDAPARRSPTRARPRSLSHGAVRGAEAASPSRPASPPATAATARRAPPSRACAC